MFRVENNCTSVKGGEINHFNIITCGIESTRFWNIQCYLKKIQNILWQNTHYTLLLKNLRVLRFPPPIKLTNKQMTLIQYPILLYWYFVLIHSYIFWLWDSMFPLLVDLRACDFPEKTIDLSNVTDKLYHIMLYTSPWSRFELTTYIISIVWRNWIRLKLISSSYLPIDSMYFPAVREYTIQHDRVDSIGRFYFVS
jgi:hypothetical protein